VDTKKFLAKVQQASDDAEFELMNRIDDLSRQADLDDQEVLRLLKGYGIDLDEAWRSYTTDTSVERNE
jgi:hypothetical protein